MKKLSLEMLRLTSDEVLGRSQMKKITGGYGTSGTCGWSGMGGFCGINKATAQALASQYPGTRWCCDSCGTTGYCGPGSGW
ncbi:hypothetical protein [Nitritalea halalkaliphila]|uniref:hypothetical protein n=1 Tax=Nitritalea halalkaliphila TaxID=590849 RepID=UPI000A028403|nr:hypothetical protein [Nitritalea halalkaliphila]